MERTYYRIFESRYVEGGAKLLFKKQKSAHSDILSVELFTSFGKSRETINWTEGYLNLFGRFCWKRPIQTQRHQIPLILTFHVFGFVLTNCSHTNVFGNNVLTDRPLDPPSETRNKLFSFNITNCYDTVS